MKKKMFSAVLGGILLAFAIVQRVLGAEGFYILLSASLSAGAGTFLVLYALLPLNGSGEAS